MSGWGGGSFQRGHGEPVPDWVPPDEEYTTEREAKSAARLAFLFAAVIFGGLGFVTGKAFGQVPEPRMSLEAGAGDCFAVVAIANRSGWYNQIETLHTTHGPVVLRYETVGGHNATDADKVSVVTLPEGVIADPEFMALPDGETGRVCLILWVGL